MNFFRAMEKMEEGYTVRSSYNYLYKYLCGELLAKNIKENDSRWYNITGITNGEFKGSWSIYLGEEIDFFLVLMCLKNGKNVICEHDHVYTKFKSEDCIVNGMVSATYNDPITICQIQSGRWYKEEE